MKYLAIILLLASCTVLEPTLEPVGTVKEVRPGKAFVVFPGNCGDCSGGAWFKLDSAYLGQQIKLK